MTTNLKRDTLDYVLIGWGVLIVTIIISVAIFGTCNSSSKQATQQINIIASSSASAKAVESLVAPVVIPENLPLAEPTPPSKPNSSSYLSKPIYSPPDRPTYHGAYSLTGRVRRCYLDGVVIESDGKLFFVKDAKCPDVPILYGYVEDVGTVTVDFGRSGKEAKSVSISDKEKAADDRKSFAEELKNYPKELAEYKKSFRDEMVKYEQDVVRYKKDMVKYEQDMKDFQNKLNEYNSSKR